MFRSWLRGRRAPPETLSLGDTDYMGPEAVNSGVLILGAPRSCKTTAGLGTLAAWLLALKARPSFVVCPAKASDRPQWAKRCRQADRSQDFVVFGPGQKYRRFNWLGYALRMGGVGAAVPMLQNLQRMLSRDQPASADAYFMPQGIDCLTQAVRAIFLATGTACVKDVHEFLNTFPRTDADVDELRECDPETAPYAYRVLRKLADLPEAAEVDYCLDYWLHQFPLLGRSEKTQACVLAIAQQVVRPFLTGPVGECMGGPDSDFTPELLEAGTVLFVDFAVLTGFEPARLAQAVVMMCVNRYALARPEGMRQIVVVADEHHATVIEGEDARVAATGRSHNLGRIYVSQNLPQYAANLGGGDRGRQESQALIGCMGTVIAFANGCRETNQHLSEPLGTELQTVYGGSCDTGDRVDVVAEVMGFAATKAHCTFSQTPLPVLPVQTFYTLRTGGPANGYVAEAIVIRANQPFADGRPWKRVSFKQVF